VLILGLDRPLTELATSFETARFERAANGFAVGRSVFRAPADAWLKGEIGDADFIDQVASAYDSVLRAWERAKSQASPAV
jgi:5-dehydro-2-deoxygluconokinase